MSLFGNKVEKEEEVQAANSSNRINKGTIITGDIETFGNIRIDGKVIGNIRSKSKVVMGPDSIMEGNIISQNAEVSGKVIGKVEVHDVLVLKETAVIDGDIITGKLIIESGAKFNGKCSMGEKKITDIKIDQGEKNHKERAKATA